VIRGTNEEMTKEDSSLDLWTESRFRVFQKVTDNANAAMLHFCAPTHPELSVRSFMVYSKSFSNFGMSKKTLTSWKKKLLPHFSK